MTHHDEIDSQPTGPRPARVIVRLDQQQRKLLDFLRAEGTFGSEDGEIVRRVVLDYLRRRELEAR
jgi:hypothetical protein